MKVKTLQDYYLELVAAWGDTPLDEEAVHEILHELVDATADAQRRIYTEMKGMR